MITIDVDQLAEKVAGRLTHDIERTAREAVESTLKPTISVKEVEEMFGVTRSTVGRWYKRGYIKRFKKGGVTVYDRKSVLEFYRANVYDRNGES